MRLAASLALLLLALCANVGESAIAPGVEHNLFKVRILRSNSTGAGSCAGCSDAACFVLSKVVLNQPAGVGDYTLTEAVDRNWITYNANPNLGEYPGTPPPAPPAAPVLATPLDGATGVPTDPALAWNASAGATAYRLQVSTGVGFWTLLVDEPNLTTTSSALSSLAAGTVFYWRVNASNAGGTSNYSRIWSFTTVPPPPPVAPVLATPVDGATGVSTNLTLAWNASAGATSYRLQVATDAGFAALVANQANLTSTSSALSFLAGNTAHYWRVNASNAGGTSGYSATWSFTTGTQAPLPPPAPVLATPVNGATGVATNPTLAWSASAGATSYRLQVATDVGFAALVANQANLTTTSSALGLLAGNTVHYWRVSASNAGGTSGYSTIWSFTTGTQALPPPAPVLATPVNGATGVATNPTLTWNASAGATSYRLQVAADAGFGALVVNQPGLTTTSYSSFSLAANTVHFWRVNASNAAGTGSYSTTRDFTTAQAPPSAPWQPDGTPVCLAPGDQGLSNAVHDGAGGVYVLCSTPSPAVPYSRTIELQRVDRNGVRPAGWPPGGYTYAEGEVWPSGLAADGAGGVYLCWFTSDFWSSSCFVLRIDANGQPHTGWPPGGVIAAHADFTPSSGYEGYLGITGLVADPLGPCYLVTYGSTTYCHDVPSCLYNYSRSVIRISPSGVVLGARTLSGCSQDSPSASVSTDGSGGLIAFVSNPCLPYREFVTWPSSGAETRLSLGPSSGRIMTLLPDRIGGVWLMGHPSPQQGELRVQRTTVTGLPVPGWEQGVGLPVRDVVTTLNLAPDSAGGLVFVWSDPSAPATVRAFRLTPDGTSPPYWEPLGLVVTPVPAKAGAFASALDGMGGAYVAWIDSRNLATTGQDIYASRVLADGSIDPAYFSGGRAVAISSPAHSRVMVVPTEPSAAIVVWSDNRNGNWDIYAQHLPLDQSTPALVSLVRAQATAQGVRLAWRFGDDVASVTLQRRIEPDAWTDLGRLTPDGLGEVAYEDRGLVAGARVGYRLVLADGRVVGEVWVTIPRVTLALTGFTPNPARSALRLAFTLASDAPGKIEVLDISGRRVFERQIAGLGPGEHQLEVEPNARPAPGVYVIRLSQGASSITARGVITR